MRFLIKFLLIVLINGALGGGDLSCDKFYDDLQKATKKSIASMESNKQFIIQTLNDVIENYPPTYEEATQYFDTTAGTQYSALNDEENLFLAEVQRIFGINGSPTDFYYSLVPYFEDTTGAPFPSLCSINKIIEVFEYFNTKISEINVFFDEIEKHYHP
jgi:hypothetical protein